MLTKPPAPKLDKLVFENIDEEANSLEVHAKQNFKSGGLSWSVICESKIAQYSLYQTFRTRLRVI